MVDILKFIELIKYNFWEKMNAQRYNFLVIVWFKSLEIKSPETKVPGLVIIFY